MSGPVPGANPHSDFRPWEVAALVLAAALFVAVRLPLLTEHGVARGWNSDAAVFGLSARRIVEHGRVDVFFWGQNYMGPLTSLSGAGVALARHGLDRRASVDPLSLRLGAMAEVVLAIFFYWLGLRSALGRPAAAASLLLLSIGPRYVFESSVTPHGDEIALLCSGVLFWLASRSLAGRRRPSLFATPSGCLLFGMAAGFGWWMNQEVVFLLLPLAVVLALRSRAWSELRPLLRPLDRLLVRPEPLGWRAPGTAALLALRGWHVLLAFAFLLALSKQAGLPVPAVYARDPVGDPVILLLATAALSETLLDGVLARHTRRITSSVAALLPRAAGFAAGFAVGYLPVAAGPSLGWYDRSYGRQSFDAGVDGLLPHLGEMARRDLWSWVGADASPAGILFLTGSLAGVLLFAWERRSRLRALVTFSVGRFGAASFAGAILIVAIGFYAVALRNGGDPRYIAPAVPVAYAVAGAGLVGDTRSRRRRAAGAAAIALLLGSGLWCLSRQAAARVSAIEAEPDPRVLISQIREQGYRVCYAGFWEAYKLQFLSEEALRFIPWKTHDRNPAASRGLALEPGRKCLVLPDGTFREFTPADVPKPMVRHGQIGSGAPR